MWTTPPPPHPSHFQGSEEDEAEQPPAAMVSPGGEESGDASAPPLSLVMLEMCKHVAAQLDITWPVAVVETPRSRYEGKKLPLARSPPKQPLPVFPELPEELSFAPALTAHSTRFPEPRH